MIAFALTPFLMPDLFVMINDFLILVLYLASYWISRVCLVHQFSALNSIVKIQGRTALQGGRRQ